MISKFVHYNRAIANYLERRFPRVFGTPSYLDELMLRISQDIEQRQVTSILEVGGADRPLLKRDSGFRYLGLDIEEKPQCFDVYDQFLVQSVEDPIPVNVDQVISITLLEHVRNNRAAIKSIFDALPSGGATRHYVPSKWHPYAIATRMVGPKAQRALIRVLRPHAASVTGYRTYFDQCSPSEMRKALEANGFVRVDIRPFYRASDYFAFFLPAYLCIVAFENVCASLHLDAFASGFVVSATKP